MDNGLSIVTLGAAIGIAKSIPGSAAERAESAAASAAESAAVAATHNYGISVEGTGLYITEPEEA